MTPTDLRKTLHALGMDMPGLARLTGRQPQTVRQWAIGRLKVPADVSDWLMRLTQWHADNPALWRKP